MISNNFILVLIVLMFIYNEVKFNKKENFTEVKNEISKNELSIDTVSINNLATLASNLISNSGKTLTLDYNQINVPSLMEGMISAFYWDWSTESQKLKEDMAEKNWYLCDGGKGPNEEMLPDLRGRIILGGWENAQRFNYGAEVTGAYIPNGFDPTKWGQKGGTCLAELKSHGHGMSANGAHSHTLLHINGEGYNGVSSGNCWNDPTTKGTSGAPNHTHAIYASGQNNPNNLPPYQCFAYFIYFTKKI